MLETYLWDSIGEKHFSNIQKPPVSFMSYLHVQENLKIVPSITQIYRMRRVWECLAESNIIQQIWSVFRKTPCIIVPRCTSSDFPTKVFVSIKTPENTWGEEVEADKTVEIWIQYNHFPADSQMSRTHRAHSSRTGRPAGT